ncbi:MAG: hypothetical protein QNK37_11260 [Acidobacteriota bacterium]|nr:hypothetical protein [Acidobacteriota bacterium]
MAGDEIQEKRQLVLDIARADIAQMEVKARYEKAQEMSTTINELHRLTIQAYRDGKMTAAEAGYLMDFVYMHLANYLASIGETENAVQSLDYSSRFYRNSSLEAGRHVQKGWILRNNPEYGILVLEEYLGRKEFMVGSPQKTAADADIFINLARFYNRVGRLEDAADTYETFLEWAESSMDYNDLLTFDVNPLAILSEFQASNSNGKGRYNQSRLKAMKRVFEKHQIKQKPHPQEKHRARKEQSQLDDSVYEKNFLRHIGELN